MTRMYLTNWMYSNNILYIGDEAKACLGIIEKFNSRLSEIEHSYSGWFSTRTSNNHSYWPDHLQYHIQYHFEGGIAIFKFRNGDDLPEVIRNECFAACKDLATEESYSVC